MSIADRRMDGQRFVKVNGRRLSMYHNRVPNADTIGFGITEVAHRLFADGRPSGLCIPANKPPRWFSVPALSPFGNPFRVTREH